MDKNMLSGMKLRMRLEAFGRIPTHRLTVPNGVHGMTAGKMGEDF